MSDRWHRRTVEEAMAFLGFSRSKVYRLIHQGQLPHVRIGARIYLVGLDEWLERQTQVPGAAPSTAASTTAPVREVTDAGESVAISDVDRWARSLIPERRFGAA